MTVRVRMSHLMNALSFVLLLAALSITPPMAAARQAAPSATNTPPAQSAPSASGTISPTMPSYPDSTGGLEHFVKDMLKLQKGGNLQQLGVYERSLALPYPDQWFESVFGKDLGAQMNVISTAMRVDAEMHTSDMLAQQLSAGRTDIEAVRFDDSCNPQATAIEYPFLLLRQKPEPLYDVRFIGKSDAMVWSYFAYVDGGFRFIGNLKKTEIGPREPGLSTNSSRRLALAANVTAARCIHRVQPECPDEAKRLGLQGTVILHLIIAQNGSVQSLYLNEGNACWPDRLWRR